MSIYSFITLVFFLLPNLAHWMFAHDYYNMVRIIPHVLDDTAPPKSTLKSKRAQFWFWLILNSIVGFACGVSAYYIGCFQLKGELN